MIEIFVKFESTGILPTKIPTQWRPGTECDFSKHQTHCTKCCLIALINKSLTILPCHQIWKHVSAVISGNVSIFTSASLVNFGSILLCNRAKENNLRYWPCVREFHVDSHHKGPANAESVYMLCRKHDEIWNGCSVYEPLALPICLSNFRAIRSS